METTDKNVLMLIALELDMPSLYKLCSTNKKMNKLVCGNQMFWMRRLNKEYPNTIGKFPLKSDFRDIYLSLKNKVKHTYYTFISQNNPGKEIPIIYDFFTRKINDIDYEHAEERFPNFIERQGEDAAFQVIGNFPVGTKMYLAYSDDRDLGIKNAYLTYEESYNVIIKVVDFFIDNDYEFRDELEEETGKTFEQFHGGTLSEVKKKIRNDLSKNVYLQIQGHDNRRSETEFPINFLIKEFNI